MRPSEPQPSRLALYLKSLIQDISLISTQIDLLICIKVTNFIIKLEQGFVLKVVQF